MDISTKDFCRRLIKYVLLAVVVAFASLVLPRQKLDIEIVLAIGLVAAATFAILDMFDPTTDKI